MVTVSWLSFVASIADGKSFLVVLAHWNLYVLSLLSQQSM